MLRTASISSLLSASFAFAHADGSHNFIPANHRSPPDESRLVPFVAAAFVVVVVVAFVLVRRRTATVAVAYAVGGSGLLAAEPDPPQFKHFVPTASGSLGWVRPPITP